MTLPSIRVTGREFDAALRWFDDAKAQAAIAAPGLCQREHSKFAAHRAFASGMAHRRGRDGTPRRNPRRHRVLPALAATIVLGEIAWLMICLV